MNANQKPFGLQLFGGVALHGPESTLTHFPHPRVSWVLTALGLIHPMERIRDELAEMLYPDRDLEQARGNLRTLLNRLRADLRQAGFPDELLLKVSRYTVGLNPSQVCVDWTLFREAARSDNPQEWEQAVELYRGDLAPGVNAEWIRWARDEARTLLAKCAERLVRYYMEENQPSLALYYLERLTRFLPAQNQWYEHALEIALRYQLPETARYWSHRTRSAANSGVIRLTPRLQQLLQEAFVLHNPSSKQSGTLLISIPRALTRFWGREREMEALQKLLDAAFNRFESRLITLTGAPGVGKTRLAMEVAYHFHTRTGAPTLFVPLRGIQSGQSLSEYVLHFLHTLRMPPRTIHATLKATLHEYQPLLLILDNFESASPTCIMELRDLLESLPSVVCLVTSRRRLNLPGEILFRVRPLPVPQRFDRAEPAINLLIDRCGVRPNAALTESEQHAAVSICQKMEGNPLGLEIVASWAPMLSLPQVAEMLQNGELLQETSNPLHAAIQHSIDTLQPAERELLTLLSLFEGRFHLAAVRAILPLSQPVPLLRALHDASLIEEEITGSVAHGQTTVYYYMFDSIRSVCAQYLTSEQREQFMERHAQYYGQLVQQIDRTLYLGDAPAALNHLDLELGNLHRALRYLWESRQYTLGCQMTLGLRHYWYLRALYREGDEWLGHYTALPALPQAVHARLLAWQGLMRSHQESMHAGEPLFQQALQEAIASNDALALRETVACYALSALYHRDANALRLCCQIGTTTFTDPQNPIDHTLRQIMQAWLAADQNDYPTAVSLCQQAQEAAQQNQFHFLECIALLNHALFCLSPDAHATTRAALLQQAIQIAQTHRYLPLESIAVKALSSIG